MQINRLFGLVYYLMGKNRATAQELANHFEVSKRTILRDIDTLSSAGIPIFAVQGKGGGISIHNSFVINKTLISEEEQQQILFALQGMSATRSVDITSILTRLQVLFEKTGTNWIEVDFSRWGNSEEDRTKFDLLKNALIKEKTIRFTYFSSYGERTTREAHPLKLAFKSVSWYLQTFCLLKNDYRTFKISRMKGLEMLDLSFDSSAYTVPNIETAEFETPDLVDIKLRIEANNAFRVYDEFDEKSIYKNLDGSFIVNMRIPHDYWLYEYLLSFGPAIEVLEPQAIRHELAKIAVKIAEKYT
ncbi:MAG: YafY family transcriptional regulator [Eubacteriaceae bacterium]|nr:YafY family transcriptional regulator [Eubacteriaceae bacterium]